MDGNSKENREFVRASLTFDVKFRVVSREEYESSKIKISQLSPHQGKSQIVDADIPAVQLERASISQELMDFLIHMDDKLDQILSLLTQNEPETVRFKKGTALDIGGAGMKMAVDSPVDVGELVHIQLVLSRMPMMMVDVYGEVVRVDTPSGGGSGFFYLGIKFSDLDINTREKIISSIFQQQRKLIRNRDQSDFPAAGDAE
ncbi:PilZ domain-containing protein [Desulfocicer niacini]